MILPISAASGGGTDHLAGWRRAEGRGLGYLKRQGSQQKPGIFADSPDMRPGFAARNSTIVLRVSISELAETVKLQRLL